MLREKEKYALVSASGAVLGIALLYLLSVTALWQIYSYPLLNRVDDGIFSLAEAHSLVLQMASITTALIVIGIVSGRMFIGSASPRRTAVFASLGTGFVLGLYTFLNFLWRSSWYPSSRHSQFLPPSDLNGYFFGEFEFLSYLLFLTPPLMMASGIVAFLFWRLLALVRNFEIG